MDNRFLRVKANTRLLLDNEDSPLFQLLRDMFIEHDATYCVKELASELGVNVFDIYKKFGGDRPLRATTLLAIMEFVHSKDPSDTRLLDFVCEPCGYVPMPKAARMNLKSVREILELAQEIVKGEEKS